MKQNYYNLSAAGQLLAGINLKKELYLAFVKIRKAVLGYESERDEIVKKFQADYRDEIEAVKKLRDNKEEVVGHDDFLAGEKEANEAIQSLLGEERPINFGEVNEDALVEALCATELKAADAAFIQDIVLGND